MGRPAEGTSRAVMFPESGFGDSGGEVGDSQPSRTPREVPCRRLSLAARALEGSRGRPTWAQVGGRTCHGPWKRAGPPPGAVRAGVFAE